VDVADTWCLKNIKTIAIADADDRPGDIREIRRRVRVGLDEHVVEIFILEKGCFLAHPEVKGVDTGTISGITARLKSDQGSHISGIKVGITRKERKRRN
jgi:2-keto-4-pentenoate hydratase